MVKRFLALFMCLVFMLSFVLVTPAYAASASDYVSGDFFSWVFEAGFHTMAGIVSPFFDDICPSAPGLTTEHSFVKKTTTVGGKTGLYYICEYCGKSAGEVGTEAYDAQVAELPAPGYDSSGALRWRLNVNSLNAKYGDLTFSQCGLSFSATCITTEIGYRIYSPEIWGYFDKFVAPIAGYYTLHLFFNADDSFSFICPNNNYYIYSSDISISDAEPVSGVLNSFSSIAFTAGSTIIDESRYFRFVSHEDSKPYHFHTISGYWEISCVPVTPPFGDTYNIQSRPTSITGDYGIIGDNGQITKVEGDYIVNETTNNYHNPATGTTTPIVDWSYDYGDRAYTLSLEGGLGVTVKYGDENITIDESTVNDSGDTVTNNYTIYYLVDGSGIEDPDPSNPPVCAHIWTETSRTEPTCISAGKVTSTCSKCNQTKTETIPATGHTWVVERTVQTTYDDSGNLLQQGYTIYMCSVCGEQYKDVDSTGPPGGGGNDDSDSGVISEIIARLKAIYDEISETVQGFFGQFTDFLKAVFPFLPEEFFAILLLGAILMVIVAALRKLIS